MFSGYTVCIVLYEFLQCKKTTVLTDHKPVAVKHYYCLKLPTFMYTEMLNLAVMALLQ